MVDYRTIYFAKASNSGGAGFNYASHNTMRKYAHILYNSRDNYAYQKSKYLNKYY